MGAAGISCSTSEMSSKGNTGMNINLDLVPLREAGMSAYEIMLSESQERMLLVLEESDIKKQKIFVLNGMFQLQELVSLLKEI